MTDAIQITVSSDIENRIDDNSSTDARHILDPLVTSIPSVETVMREKMRSRKKGQPIR
jgi:hypothetical protein